MGKALYTEIIKVFDDSGYDYELRLPTTIAKEVVSEYLKTREELGISGLSVYDENLGDTLAEEFDFNNSEVGTEITLIGAASTFINLDWWKKHLSNIYVDEIGSFTLWLDYEEVENG